MERDVYFCLYFAIFLTASCVSSSFTSILSAVRPPTSPWCVSCFYYNLCGPHQRCSCWDLSSHPTYTLGLGGLSFHFTCTFNFGGHSFHLTYTLNLVGLSFHLTYTLRLVGLSFHLMYTLGLGGLSSHPKYTLNLEGLRCRFNWLRHFLAFDSYTGMLKTLFSNVLHLVSWLYLLWFTHYTVVPHSPDCGNHHHYIC